MIGDYYGDGNRYRGVTSKGSATRTIVVVGNAVLFDTANERPDADKDTQGTTDANNVKDEVPKGEARPHEQPERKNHE